MKITLKTSVLRAALICAAKKDLRYYLQGVCISINGPDVAMVYGTDGHILFAGQCPIVVIDAPASYGFQIIIPSDTIKAIDKKSEFIDLETIEGGESPHNKNCPGLASVLSSSASCTLVKSCTSSTTMKS